MKRESAEHKIELILHTKSSAMMKTMLGGERVGSAAIEAATKQSSPVENSNSEKGILNRPVD